MPFVLDAFIAACWAFDDHLVAALALERVRTDRRREAQGVYKGRPPSIDATKVAALKAEGLGASEIAKGGRASIACWPAPSVPAPNELSKALAQNPRFKVLPLSGKGSIIGGQTPSKG